MGNSVVRAIVTEACDGGADDALSEDEHRHEREPVGHLLLLLLGLVAMDTVAIATLRSAHVTPTPSYTSSCDGVVMLEYILL